MLDQVDTYLILHSYPVDQVGGSGRSGGYRYVIINVFRFNRDSPKPSPKYELD